MGQEQPVEELDISKPGVSRALSSLEGKGYVVRQPDPDDRRARRVRLTSKARKIGPAIEQVYNEVYARAVRGIFQEELTTFVELFSRMLQNFAGQDTKKK
jgi:MarR family transcriptional regulator for hemolysin